MTGQDESPNEDTPISPSDAMRVLDEPATFIVGVQFRGELAYELKKLARNTHRNPSSIAKEALRDYLAGRGVTLVE